MKTLYVFAFSVVIFAGCTKQVLEVDTTPPAPPQGIKTISLNNAVELQWLPSTDPDVAGYNIWQSDRYDGAYVLLGTTSMTRFTDYNAKNGFTYYYAVSTFDFSHNESVLSKDVVYDTPRPEGFGVLLSDYKVSPRTA